MTLISTINSVADIVGLDRLTAIVGSGDENAQTMLSLANEAGDEISKRVDWERQIVEFPFSASPTAIPPDFQRVAPGSGVKVGTLYARPVTNSGQWGVIKSSGSTIPYYFVSNSVIQVSLPTSDMTLSYISGNWVINTSGRYKTFIADDDTTTFPQTLLQKNIMWRWRRQQGLAFDDYLAEFEADLASEIKADRGVS